MQISAIKLPRLSAPQDDLFKALDSVEFELSEESVVAVSSKVVAIHQGRCVALESVKTKDDLIYQEAELYMERSEVPGGHVMHTLKHHMLVGSAGIDESNAAGHYVLLPNDPDKFAQKLWQYLIKRFGLKKLGVIITDSHSIPLRRGTVGISMGSFGFEPLHDYRGTQDLFGRELVMSISNLADGLAAAATVAMGEGNEQTPVAVMGGLTTLRFIVEPYKSTSKFGSFYVEPKEDLFKPYFDYLPWKEGGAGRGSKKP